MSFPDKQSLFVPPGFGTSSDAITITAWPQHSVVGNQYHDHNTHFAQPRSLKRPREEEKQSDTNFMPTSSVRVNTGANNNIFYKTRVCANFLKGQCRNSEMCKFAHGDEDLRKPPPNWKQLVNGRGDEDRDDEQRISLKMKLCKKFSNGEVCPYGDKCNFLHDDQKRHRDDSARMRDSSAVSIGVSLSTASGHVWLDQTDANLRTEHWKTRPCSNFKGFVGQVEGDLRSVKPLATPMRPVVGVPNHLVSSTLYNTVSSDEQLVKKDFSKLKGSKEINRIYGDWIDDIPLDAP